MSATSRNFRGPAGTDEAARAHARLPGHSTVYQLAATDNRPAPMIARLTLGLVMFPHAAQKVLGWFGGSGLEGTFGFFTKTLGLAGWLAAAAIITEAVCSVLLILGAFTRLAALGIIAVMLGAIVTVHLPHGFFMNWTGTQAGEGYEYHLLAIGLGVVIAFLGGGMLSVDRRVMRRRPRAITAGPAPVTLD